MSLQDCQAATPVPDLANPRGLERAGRQPAAVYRQSVLYTTLSPCAMCSGAILLYGIPTVVIGENMTFRGEEELLRARGSLCEFSRSRHASS